MQLRLWLVALTICGGILACNDDGVGSDATSSDWRSDRPYCPQPPDITYCHKPPNFYSQTLWYCASCGLCSGGPQTAACDGFNGDCRYFYDTCIPKSYTRCDKDAPDNILGYCGDCFLREAGGIPKHCDKLSVDAGPTSDSKHTSDSKAAIDGKAPIDGKAAIDSLPKG